MNQVLHGQLEVVNFQLTRTLSAVQVMRGRVNMMCLRFRPTSLPEVMAMNCSLLQLKTERQVAAASTYTRTNCLQEPVLYLLLSPAARTTVLHSAASLKRNAILLLRPACVG